jgi:tetratricopeptide (TPR) repeat protein
MVEAVSQPSAAPVAGRRPRSWGTVAVVAILLAAGAAAYSNSFRGPFILDDLKLIPDNPALRGDWSPWHLAFSSNFRTRPVIALTVAMNYALGGLDVRGYHAVNLVIHLLAALVLFGVVRRTLRLPALAERFAGASTGLALAVALLWMLHPLQTQSVTYIIQRCESMMGLFYLLTLYAVVRGTTSPRPLGWYAAAVVACAFGIWSKQAAVTAPLIVLLYDRTFLAGSLRESLRRRWRLYAALAATWAAILPYFFVTQVTQKWLAAVAAPRASTAAGEMPTPWAYLATQFGVVAHYLRLTVWPDALCLDYGWPLATTVSTILPPALLILGLLGLTGWALVRRPAAGFVGAAFFIVLAPTSSVVPIEDVAFEHRMYLPLAAVIAAAVMLGYIGWTRMASRAANGAGRPRWVRWAVPPALVALVAGACGVRTYVRNDDYRTAATIWRDTVTKRPLNARARVNLGVRLTAEGKLSGNSAESDEAIGHFREAMTINPDYAEAHGNLAAALTALGRMDEAIRHCEEALRIKPEYPEAHCNLAIILEGRGRTDEAIRHYREALRIKPDFAEAHCSMGSALEGRGQTDDAITHYREALRIKPDFAEAHSNLAIALVARGRTDEAIRHFYEALRIKPDLAKTHYNLGIALTTQRRTDEAIIHYQESLRIEPDLAEAHYNLAIVLGARGQSAEAFRHYQEALRIKPDFADAHYNLANALARQGQNDEAIRHYQDALRANPDYAEAHSNLAIALMLRGQTDEAIRHYQDALRVKPDYLEAHYNLATALESRGQTEAAVTHYRQALRANPDLVQALRNLAWIMATDSDPKRRNGPEALRVRRGGAIPGGGGCGTRGRGPCLVARQPPTVGPDSGAAAGVRGRATLSR